MRCSRCQTFMMTGELLNRCGMTEHLIRLATSLVGWVRGGLAHVTVVTGMLLACISGSAIADSATLGPLMIPAMVKERYPAPFAASVAAPAAVIGGDPAAQRAPGHRRQSARNLDRRAVSRRRHSGHRHRPSAYADLVGHHAAKGLRRRPRIRRRADGDQEHSFCDADTLGAGNHRRWNSRRRVHAGRGGRGRGALFNPSRLLLLPKAQRRGARGAILATARITAAALIIVGTSLVFGRLLTYEQVPQKLLELLLGLPTTALC